MGHGGLVLSNWRLAVATATGVSHERSGLPCQDKIECRVLVGKDGSEIVAVALSDGAGSALRAEEGATIATSMMIERFAGHIAAGNLVSTIDQPLVEQWIESVRLSIQTTATDQELTVRDFACTLLCIMISDTGSVFFQIGDGAIVVCDEVEDTWSWIFWPDHGEFANTTSFITEDGFQSKLQFSTETNRILEAALFSDGLERLVLAHATKAVHEPFFKQLFPILRRSQIQGVDDQLCESLKSFLQSPAVCERTDDDKALVMLTRRAPIASHAEADIQA
jgi:hypothetical protein